MRKYGNPWIDQFSSISNINAIKAKTEIKLTPLIGLKDSCCEEAADRIKDAWEGTFYPTERDCAIMLEVVQSALSHAKRHHPDSKTHLANAYRESIDFEPYIPMMLMGPAGTGKSSLGKALIRLFPEPSSIIVDSGHGPMSLTPIRSVKAQGQNSVAAVVRLLAPDPSAKIKTSHLYDLCARYQYACGTCCILVDELQFFTQSASANTLLTQLLLGISYVKVPFLVIANYSLVHRLMRRNSEEIQRLIGRPVVLLPDGPTTKDWLGVLGEYQRLVPRAFTFTFRENAVALWSLCAGLKRVLVRLLVLAYRLSRKGGRFSVSWTDVEAAYLHIEFSGYRGNVEALILHGVTSSALAEDMRSPFPLPLSEAEKFNAALRSVRERKVADAALDASLSVSERKAVDSVTQMSRLASNENAPSNIKLKKKSPSKRTAESLKEAGERFRKNA